MGSKEGEAAHLRLPLRALLGDQGFDIIHAHVSKLNLENSIGMACIRPTSSAQTARVLAKWTNMVVCVRGVAGIALGVVGSRHRSADRWSAARVRRVDDFGGAASPTAFLEYNGRSTERCGPSGSEPQRNRGPAMTSLNFVLAEAASTGSSLKALVLQSGRADCGKHFAASKDQTLCLIGFLSFWTWRSVVD